MRELDVVVKEPISRRASFDDYQLCFENYGKQRIETNPFAQVNQRKSREMSSESSFSSFKSFPIQDTSDAICLS